MVGLFVKDFKRENFISYAFICLLLTAIVLPFSTALTNVFFIAMAVFWLLGANLRKDVSFLKSQPFAIFLLLFLLVVFLSAFWKEGSWSSYFSELRNYRRFLFFLIAFLLIKDKKDWSERVLFCFYISTAVLTLVCLGIYLGVPFLPSIRAGQGAVLSKSHIAQGFLLGCHIVLAIRYLVFSAHIEMKVLSAITAVLAFVVTVFMTYGRTGYLCVICAIFFAAVFFVLQKKKKLGILISILLVVSVAMVAMSGHVQSRWENAKEDISQFSQGKMDTSMGLRFFFWETSIQMIQDNPVVGVGCGSIEDASCQYARRTPKKDGSCFRFSNPHQDYLYIFAQYGIVGFIFWLLFFCSVLRESFRYSMENKWGTWGIVGVYLAGSFFNSFSRDITEGTTFVLLLAALIALGRVVPAEMKQEDKTL